MSPKFFDPHKAPATDLGRAYVSTVTERLLVIESSSDPYRRKRARKRADANNFALQVAALVSNLVEAVTLCDERPVLIQRSDLALCRRSRYKPVFITKKLKQVLDLMIEGDFIYQELGTRANMFQAKGEATKISAGHALLDLAPPGLTAKDFGRLPPHETIILKDAHPSIWERGKWIDYADTAQTMRWREEMRGINLRLAEADISYRGHPLTPSERHLYRVFTGGSFDEHGRLYGGLWQIISKVERKASLRIAGKPVLCLDYGQMLVRLSYSYVGVQPPPGDLYIVKPWGEAYRPGFKRLIPALLNRKTPMKRRPKDFGTLLPPIGIASIIASVQKAHPGICSLLNSNVAPLLTLIESELLIDVLAKLSSLNITALPIHDAILVADDQAEKAEEIMRQLFIERLAVPCSITTE